MIFILILSPVNIGCYPRQPGDQVHRIVKDRIPVVFFIQPLGIFLGKLAFRLQSHDRNNELGHRMRILRQSLDRRKHMVGYMTAPLPVGCDLMHIFLRRQLTHQHQMEKTLGQRLCASLRLRQSLLQFRYRIAAKPDPLLSVQQRSLADQSRNTPHSLVDL